MSKVGILANPSSGKDIRRLTAFGSVVDNNEKTAIVRRVLLGLDAVGVAKVLIMPDRFGIGPRALDGLELNLAANILEMRPRFSQEDSAFAASAMVAAGVGCLITLGGDGTNRIVAKASGMVPIMPIAAGTNNVFPQNIEGTIAGLAAGLVAEGHDGDAITLAPRIEVLDESDEVRDIALVDAAVYGERFVASRAIWDASKIRELVLARAAPGTIGLSSIGSHLPAGAGSPDRGVYVRIAPEGRAVKAALAPGLIQPVHVADHRLLAAGDEVVLSSPEPSVLALDGEREIELRIGSKTRLRISASGPAVVDARRTVAAAAHAGLFWG